MFKNNSILATLVFSTFGVVEYLNLGFEITVLTLLICILTELYSISLDDKNSSPVVKRYKTKKTRG